MSALPESLKAHIIGVYQKVAGTEPYELGKVIPGNPFEREADEAAVTKAVADIQSTFAGTGAPAPEPSLSRRDDDGPLSPDLVSKALADIADFFADDTTEQASAEPTAPNPPEGWLSQRKPLPTLTEAIHSYFQVDE